MASHVKYLNIPQIGGCRAPGVSCRRCRENKIIQILQHNCGVPSEVATSSPECNCQSLERDRHDAFKDCVIVSLDVETTKNQRKLRKIGIYTLNTRDLDISKKTSTPEMTHILKTYSFYTGVYRHKNRRNFHYGKEEMMTGHDLKSMLEQVFRTGSPVPQSSEPRQVILTSNGIWTDLQNLRNLELTPDLEDLPNIILVDTTDVFKDLIKEKTRLCLWAMLHFFQIPCRNSLLHNGGNDANLTLKALMMLTLESCKKLDWSAEQEEVKALMMLHAREELPGAKRRRKNEMNKEATIARKEAFRATRIYYWADNDEDEDSCLVFSFENE